MRAEPFWEATYGDPASETFGGPADEVIELAGRLAAGARVLDAGCGEGRHALFLARSGHRVDAFDRSERGIAKLGARAAEEGLAVQARVADLRDTELSGPYDLVICHGVLHLLERSEWLKAIPRLQAATKVGGWNVVVVFTDRLPPPEDLAPFTRGPFREGELERLYAGWDIERAEAYTLDDEHPGGIRHRHPVNKVVARRVR